MATIILHKNIEGLLKLSKNILKKHKEDGLKSPLTKIELAHLNIMLKDVQPKYNELLKLRAKANQLNDEIQLVLGIHRSEKKIVQGTARFIVAQVRDVLKGIYRHDLYKLKEWGFEVITKEKNTSLKRNNYKNAKDANRFTQFDFNFNNHLK